MAEAAADPKEQLIEYEKQLAEINELISGDPSNPSLDNLRSDLLELIALTKADIADAEKVSSEGIGAGTDGTTSGSTAPVENFSAVESRGSGSDEAIGTPAASAGTVHEENDVSPSSESTEVAKKSKKRSASSLPPAKFEIPPHLIPLESDSEGAKKQKRRTIKALKRKWKEKVKEAELGQKQSNWQDFVGGGKRKKKNQNNLTGVNMMNKKGSIFATEDGVGARVGVIGSGRTMTEYTKRVKHG